VKFRKRKKKRLVVVSPKKTQVRRGWSTVVFQSASLEG
jgi:hypothetical protein